MTKPRSMLYLPELLLGMGIAFNGIALITAVKTTSENPKILEKPNADMRQWYRDILSLYRYPIAAAVTGTTALVLSYKVQRNRTSSLYELYKMSDSAAKEYRAIVEDVASKKIKKAISDRLTEPANISNDTTIFGSGSVLCYDAWTGRYFYVKSVEELRRVFISLNEALYSNDFVPLNDLYAALNIPSISSGNDIGWEIEHGPISFDLTSKLTESDKPCLVMIFNLSYRWEKK